MCGVSQSCKKIQKLALSCDNFIDIWLKLHAILDHEELAEATYIFAHIWQRRNEFLFQGNFRHPNALLHKAKNELFDYFQSLQIQPLRYTTVLAPDLVKWMKPPIEWYELN